MSCDYCRRKNCEPGAPGECWEAMLAASLPIADVLSMLKSDKKQHAEAAERRSKRE